LVVAATGGKRQGMVARPNNPAGDGDSGGRAVGKPFAKARRLQRGLYVAAKRNRERRFHALFDRIWRGDVPLDASGSGYVCTLRYPGGVHAAREDHR
jgi:RNA-directed DNA polymerase